MLLPINDVRKGGTIADAPKGLDVDHSSAFPFLVALVLNDGGLEVARWSNHPSLIKQFLLAVSKSVFEQGEYEAAEDADDERLAERLLSRAKLLS